MVLGVVLILLSVSPASSEEMLLSGSSMLLPLNRVWAKAYGNIRPVTVIQATGPGSGAGIDSAVMGYVTIGVSGLFFAEKNPKRKSNTVFVPVRLGGTLPIVNMPPTLPLKNDGPLLARIFSGKIRFWDDPSLVSLNGRRALSRLPIRIYRRSDSSGTSFILTDYRARASSLWRNSIGWETLPGRPEFWDGPAAFSGPGFPSGFDRSIVWNIEGKNACPASNIEFWLVSPDLPGPAIKKDRSLLALDLTKGQGWEYAIRNGFVPLPGVPGDPRLGRRFLELLPGNTYRPVSGG